MERIGPPTPVKLLMLMLTTPWYKIPYLILGPKLKFLNLNELKKELILGKSLVRWGDGETALARGKSISYQSASSTLQLILKIYLKQQITILYTGYLGHIIRESGTKGGIKNQSKYF